MTPKYSGLLRDREMENIHRLQLADPPVSCISWRAFALWAGLSPIVSCPFVVHMPTTGLASSCHAFWQVWVQCIVWHQIYWIKVLTNWPPQLHILSQNFALFNFHCILCIEYFSAVVHNSFDVLPSGADQGSCAHNCVCYNFLNRREICRK